MTSIYYILPCVRVLLPHHNLNSGFRFSSKGVSISDLADFDSSMLGPKLNFALRYDLHHIIITHYPESSMRCPDFQPEYPSTKLETSPSTVQGIRPTLSPPLIQPVLQITQPVAMGLKVQPLLPGQLISQQTDLTLLQSIHLDSGLGRPSSTDSTASERS